MAENGSKSPCVFISAFIGAFVNYIIYILFQLSFAKTRNLVSITHPTNVLDLLNFRISAWNIGELLKKCEFKKVNNAATLKYFYSQCIILSVKSNCWRECWLLRVLTLKNSNENYKICNPVNPVLILRLPWWPKAPGVEWHQPW